jgi:hypothetical protein
MGSNIGFKDDDWGKCFCVSQSEWVLAEGDRDDVSEDAFEAAAAAVAMDAPSVDDLPYMASPLGEKPAKRRGRRKVVVVVTSVVREEDSGDEEGLDESINERKVLASSTVEDVDVEMDPTSVHGVSPWLLLCYTKPAPFT